MKKSLVIWLVILAVALLSSAAPAYILVFTSGKSTRYHNSGCRYLKGRVTALSLDEARSRGLKPCKSCKPQ